MGLASEAWREWKREFVRETNAAERTSLLLLELLKTIGVMRRDYARGPYAIRFCVAVSRYISNPAELAGNARLQ